MTTLTETTIDLPAGVLHVYDTGEADRLPVFWHHGSPNIGSPPAPLFAASDRLGVRWVSYDRPGYGGSTPAPGRDVASAATYTAAVADALGLDRFAVMGHSGGGPHALACAALLRERVRAVVVGAGLAPYDADGLDWYAGMADSGAASLRAAAAGRAAREAHEESAVEGDMGFIEADVDALQGDWSWLISVVRPALAGGPAALIDDDLACVGPWGFGPAQVTAPTLILHGGRDAVVPSAHGAWLAEHCGPAELRLHPDDGHVSVLRHAEEALAWLVDRA